jgi:hypothetical protein
VAEDVDGRGGRRWLLLVLLIAGAAWFVWARRGSAPVALGNIGAVEAPTPLVTLPVAAALPVPATADPVPGPLPGSAPSLPDGSPPGPEYTIKGNAGSMLYHLPSSPYYKRTKPGMWFRTPEDARAAGFTEWRPKKRATG